MNYSVIRRILGKIMILIGLLMVFPFGVSLIYKESLRNILAFAIPMVSLIIVFIMIKFSYGLFGWTEFDFIGEWISSKIVLKKSLLKEISL